MRELPAAPGLLEREKIAGQGLICHIFQHPKPNSGQLPVLNVVLKHAQLNA